MLGSLVAEAGFRVLNMAVEEENCTDSISLSLVFALL